MAHEQAAFSEKARSNQHSVVREKQNQPQPQRSFTAKDAEGAKESKQNQHQNQRPFTAEPLHGADAEDAKEEEGVQQRAEALALKLAQTYEELTRLLERNPGVKRQITEGEAKEDKVYQKLKQRLKLADMAPRCQWVKQDGTSCRSPQMKQHIYCFAHKQMMEARELMLMLPAMEDANAIQMGLMRIQKALVEDTISTKKAGLLLYSMQLAVTNVGQTTFGQAKDEEMVRETVSEEDAFGENLKPLTTARQSRNQKRNIHHGGTETLRKPKPTAKSQSQKPQHRETSEDAESRRFTERNSSRDGTNLIVSNTEDTKDTEEEKTLPLMNADERGFKTQIPFTTEGTTDRQENPGDIEFVPVPGGHGYHRMRLAIEPSLTGERKPPQAIAQPGAAVPHEHAQTYYSSLRDELGCSGIPG